MNLIIFNKSNGYFTENVSGNKLSLFTARLASELVYLNHGNINKEAVCQILHSKKYKRDLSKNAWCTNLALF